MFKKDKIDGFKAGETLGLCCTDACGMASNFLTNFPIPI